MRWWMRELISYAGHFKENILFRDRSDPLAFPDNYLYERHTFWKGLQIFVDYWAYTLQIAHATIKRSQSRKNVTQIVCTALCFFASWTFLYTVGDAENISKASVCHSVQIVYLSFKKLLNVFINFPGYRAIHTIKQTFYGIAGKFK